MKIQVINMTFQTPRGTKDIMPEEMIRYDYVISVIKDVFEKYGFDPLDTPAFEDWALLSAKQGGGEAVKDEIYYFKDKSNRELGLRFDLTVPLGRLVANNPDLPKPFKRYQIGKAWRYDNPGAMRWREFTQADIDIVGSDSLEAEAECLKAVCEIFLALGFSDFSVRVNSRKIADNFIRSIGLTDAASVFRSIDKLEKIGESGVKKELAEKGIPEKKADQIIEFVRIRDLEKAKKIAGPEGIDDLEKIIDMSGEFRRYLIADMSLIRGLDYYTGVVFEISLGAGVSVGGGGRYDNLTEVCGGKKTPAVGISIGISRLVSVMEERKMLSKAKTKCLVFVISVSSEAKKGVAGLVQKLRSIGIPADFDIMSRTLSKQLQYVNSRGIPFAIVVGEKELKSGSAKIRDMKTGKEEEFEFRNPKKIARLVKPE